MEFQSLRKLRDGTVMRHITRMRYAYLAALLVLVCVVVVSWLVFFYSPFSFPAGQVFTVTPGESVEEVGTTLQTEGYINSALLFKALVRFVPGEAGVRAGKYVFWKPAGMYAIAWNLSHGISGIPTTRITFPEGTTARQMGRALATALPGFDEHAFIATATPEEGYLFPDTYFFLPDTSADEAVAIMRANFDVNYEKLDSEAASSSRPESQVVIMASLLEGEAKTLSDKRIIAGIFWRRLDKGMPLQADAAFGYFYGKTGYVPTALDLMLNMPYNTYLHKGLPPTPINNPGEDSLLAALTPTKTKYLFYVTGKDGVMHYAATLAEQHANQKKYLK